MRAYRAVITRHGDWWAIDVPEVLGVHTQTKSLDDVEAMAVDAIAVALACDPKEVAVCVDGPIARALREQAAFDERQRLDAIAWASAKDDPEYLSEILDSATNPDVK